MAFIQSFDLMEIDSQDEGPTHTSHNASYNAHLIDVDSLLFSPTSSIEQSSDTALSGSNKRKQQTTAGPSGRVKKRKHDSEYSTVSKHY
jgi:hypothetical protein